MNGVLNRANVISDIKLMMVSFMMQEQSRNNSLAKKIVVASAITLSVSACALLPMEGESYRGAKLGHYSPHYDNEYMAGFDALQQEIDQLKGELATSKARSAEREQQKLDAAARQEKIRVMKEKANAKVAEVKNEIDRLIASLSNQVVTDPEIASHQSPSVESVNQQIEQVPTAAIAETENLTLAQLTSDNLETETNPEPVVKKEPVSLEIEKNEILSGQSGIDLRYDVVYVFDEEPPQDTMWGALNQADIMDKWRGVNQQKQSFFIYVGVYNSLNFATNRQDSLAGLTGAKPTIKTKPLSPQLSFNDL